VPTTRLVDEPGFADLTSQATRATVFERGLANAAGQCHRSRPGRRCVRKNRASYVVRRNSGMDAALEQARLAATKD
jgi:hypothetical protein